LPGARRLEGDDGEGVVLPVPFAVPDARPRTESFRFSVPPGATRMRFTARGEVTGVYLDGVPLGTTGPDIELPGGHRPARRTAELHVRTRPEDQAGAALAGPVEFTIGPGTIGLGDWEEQGLAGYSGGVRYKRALDLAETPARAELDLGRVRGTAEVTVNGNPVGVRICSPYVVDLGTSLRACRNAIEIVVYGTLAPYLDETSPTHFVFAGQRTTGLLGPVTLRISEEAAPPSRPSL